MTRNDENAEDGLDPHVVAAAVADAVAEHDAWLRGWQRSMACGLTPGHEVLDENAHRSCRFGRWIEVRGGATAGDPVLGDLRRAHRQMHEAARAAAQHRSASGVAAPVDYDAAIAAADCFRHAARQVRENCGTPEDDTAPEYPLNDLQERLTMLGELERERERALRTGTELSLMMVRPEEMDEVKRVHGRAGLDRVVAGLATRLFGLLRPYDGIFRHGTADFIVCLPGTTAEQAASVADRLVDGISGISVLMPDNSEVSVRVTFGIAAIDTRSPVQETLERAMRAATEASGRTGTPVVVWAPERKN